MIPGSLTDLLDLDLMMSDPESPVPGAGPQPVLRRDAPLPAQPNLRPLHDDRPLAVVTVLW